MVTLYNYMRSLVTMYGTSLRAIAESVGKNPTSLWRSIKDDAPTTSALLMVTDAVSAKVVFRCNGECLPMTKENTTKKETAEDGDFSTEIRKFLVFHGVKLSEIAKLRCTTQTNIYTTFKHNSIHPSLMIDIAEVTGGEFGIVDKEGVFFKIDRENTKYKYNKR